VGFFTSECFLHHFKIVVTHHTELKEDNLEKMPHRNFSTKSGYMARSVCTVKVNAKFNVFMDNFFYYYVITFPITTAYQRESVRRN